MSDRCVFCGTTLLLTEHHILPTEIKRLMGWKGKKAKKFYSNKKVTICEPCHQKLTLLEEPLCFIIKSLFKPEIGIEFAYTVQNILEMLNNEPAD